MKKLSEQIPIDKIKPSPYQPRLMFDLEDIRGSIEKDGILVALTVREKVGFYELIDGERRLRLAKQLGYTTVKCDVVDVGDEVARRMVWKVNTLRKDYEPKEKAHFFKKMLKPPYGMSLRGIAREYDQSTRTVKAYLNVFKIPKDYQQMVWDRLIPLGVILELEPLFNGVEYSTPEDNPEIFIVLDRAKKEKGFDFMQAREAMKPYLAKLRKEQVDKAKEALAEVEPEVKAPETPEEFEKAAQALKREATKKRESKLTPEEKANREAEKQRKKEEQKRKREEKKRKEEAKRKKREEQIRKEAEEQTRQKLLRDKDFFVDIISREAKVISAISESVPALTKEQIEKATEAFQKSEKDLEQRRSNPKLVERSILVKNWLSHTQVVALSKSIMCPVCKANFENLVWKCHDIPVMEAQKTLKRQLEEN